MHVRRFSLAVLLGLFGCAGTVPGPASFTPTSDPVTRLVDAEPGAILQAGIEALRGLGFEISAPAPGMPRVYSGPIVIQSAWRGSAVAQRVRCGIGTAAASDPYRVTQLSNTIPVELQLGYEVEPRPGVTATKILFNAQGRRSGAEFLTSPTMPCTLTVHFVDELFAAIEAELRGTM